MGINLKNMASVNGYKLENSDPNQWVIVVDKMVIVNGLEYLTFYLKEICFENQECKYFGMIIVKGLE